jgi:SAM-dependent methyltransferase
MSALIGEVPPDWYADAYSATTSLLPWNDDPDGDLERALRILDPLPGSRVLDLGCGSGHHALELAERGFSVVGVDISEDLVAYADEVAFASDEAGGHRGDLRFLHSDLRDLTFAGEFDVVLNLHDGAIGYLEDDAENRRTFETIARCLRPGGRTLMQIPNVLFAETALPAKTWTEGRFAIELLDRHWNAEDRYLEGWIVPIVLDDPAWMRAIPFRQRLYSVEELFELFCAVGMSLEAVLDDAGLPSAPTEEQPEIFVLASRD